jgi:hypothetical protein
VSITVNRLDTGFSGIVPAIEECDVVITRERRRQQMTTEKSRPTDDQ